MPTELAPYFAAVEASKAAAAVAEQAAVTAHAQVKADAEALVAATKALYGVS